MLGGGGGGRKRTGLSKQRNITESIPWVIPWMSRLSWISVLYLIDTLISIWEIPYCMLLKKGSFYAHFSPRKLRDSNPSSTFHLFPITARGQVADVSSVSQLLLPMLTVKRWSDHLEVGSLPKLVGSVDQTSPVVWPWFPLTLKPGPPTSQWFLNPWYVSSHSFLPDLFFFLTNSDWHSPCL